MSCDGNISKLEFGGTGKIQRLECCPTPKQEKQELVKNWKRTRRDTFTTIPTPYGYASFSNVALMVGVSGPPKPGDAAVQTAKIGVVIISSGGDVISPPESAPAPDEGAAD